MVERRAARTRCAASPPRTTAERFQARRTRRPSYCRVIARFSSREISRDPNLRTENDKLANIFLVKNNTYELAEKPVGKI